MSTQPKPASVKIEKTPPRMTVKVWELPVRITHWVIFLAVVVLSVTGFYIARPFIIVGSDPGFLMGWMRATHSLAAWVFIAAIAARVIWSLVGNRWSRWDQFIPVSKDRRTGGREMFKYYTFMRRDPAPEVGHNPLAGLAYSAVYLMFGVQIVTGFALLGLENPGGIFYSLTGWVFDIGSIPTTRLIHHMIMWLTWGFVVHHVYSAVLVDIEERNGLISSIVTGRKEVEESLLDE
ncbi:MAG: Ni/Fe-hydrogenase, b-type cytochrome subunit [Acidimicrobiia bacterium]